MKKELYINYGDINPLDYEGLWLRKTADNEYCYVRVENSSWYENDEIPMYTLSNGFIDTVASWIDRESVINYAQLDKNIDSNSAEYAIACLEYYGNQEFSSLLEECRTTSRRVARRYINRYGIVIHRNKVV